MVCSFLTKNIDISVRDVMCTSCSTFRIYSRRQRHRLPDTNQSAHGRVFMTSVSELLHLNTPSRDPRSSADTRILKIPRSNSEAFGQRSFSHVGPSTWNGLPYSLPILTPQTSFRQTLKTHLFQQRFLISTLVSLTYFPQYEFLTTCSCVPACTRVFCSCVWGFTLPCM